MDPSPPDEPVVSTDGASNNATSLTQVRVAIARLPDVDPDELRADLDEHIDPQM
jgi:hypothetical protein